MPRPAPQISHPGDYRRASRVGGTLTLKLHIDAEAPADFPSDVVEVVNANAKTLKFEQSVYDHAGRDQNTAAVSFALRPG